MKKILSFLVVLVLMAASAIAHPGGTDGKGGHTDRSTGIYHYHHGYEAHQHEDGVCPYDFDDKTGEGSGSSGGSGSAHAASISSVSQTLCKGDRGDDVKQLQLCLEKLGYSIGTADGIFGARTERAVKEYQKANGLAETGVVGVTMLKLLFPEMAPKATATSKPTNTPKLAAAIKHTDITESTAKEKGAMLEWIVVCVVAVLIIVPSILNKREKRLIEEQEREQCMKRYIHGQQWLEDLERDRRLDIEGIRGQIDTNQKLLENWTDPDQHICLREYTADVPVAVYTGLPMVYHRIDGPCVKQNPTYKTMYFSQMQKTGYQRCDICRPRVRPIEAFQADYNRLTEEAARDLEAARRIEAAEKERQKREKEKALIEYRRKFVQEAMLQKKEPDLSEGVVYISADVKHVYHHDKYCDSVSMLMLVSKKSIEHLNLRPCSKCGNLPQPEYDLTVSVSPKALYWHSRYGCLSPFTRQEVPLSLAKQMKKYPCPRCKPPTENPKVWF